MGSFTKWVLQKKYIDTPENIFVGGFIGSPAMNFFTGTLQDNYFHIENIRFKVPDGQLKTLKKKGYNGKEIILGIRPEDIHDEPIVLQSSPESTVKITVEVAELLGAETMIHGKLASQNFVARINARDNKLKLTMTFR